MIPMAIACHVRVSWRSEMMESAREFFVRLNHDYLKVHKTKEDLFWDTYMAVSDDHAAFARAEQAFKDFIADPSNLAEV